jgi:uncharacterized protein
MTIEQIIQSKIGILPEQKQAEVLNFVNFLIASQTEINPEQENDIQPKLKRVLGLNKGEISMSEDFNNPLCLEHSIEQSATTKSLFSRLKQIKIPASADFFENPDEYPNIEHFCKQNHIRRLSLFGSMLRDDFTTESDVDILVEFEVGKTPGLGIISLQDRLSSLLGRVVDLRTVGDLSRYFRDEVLQEMKVIYEQN